MVGKSVPVVVVVADIATMKATQVVAQVVFELVHCCFTVATIVYRSVCGCCSKRNRESDRTKEPNERMIERPRQLVP